jgi:hypothetical protein
MIKQYRLKLKNKISENPQVISYLTLRKAVGILGISFPVILVLGSVVFGDCKEIQGSISSYYHTSMRNVFIGVMCALAFFLFAYKGYDRRDAIAGNLGCIFALGVAFFPTAVTEPLTDCIPLSFEAPVISSIHFISAGSLFIVFAYFSICLFTKGSPDPTSRKLKRNKLYRFSGYTIVASIGLIALYFIAFEKRHPAFQNYHPVFWLESIALWAFGIAWLTKGKALLNDLENADSNAINS